VEVDKHAPIIEPIGADHGEYTPPQELVVAVSRVVGFVRFQHPPREYVFVTGPR
jgi:hypothetical protein